MTCNTEKDSSGSNKFPGIVQSEGQGKKAAEGGSKGSATKAAAVF